MKVATLQDLAQVLKQKLQYAGDDCLQWLRPTLHQIEGNSSKKINNLML